jgi:hypothetical protein
MDAAGNSSAGNYNSKMWGIHLMCATTFDDVQTNQADAAVPVVKRNV